MLKNLQRFTCLLALLLITGSVGCGPPAPATTGLLHIDNTAENPMKVWVDGQEIATVKPGEVQSVTVPLGEHHLAVKGKGLTAYNQQCNLEAVVPEKSPWLMLKTNSKHRYCRLELVYGNDRVTRGMADGMSTMIIQACAKKAVGDDPAAQDKWIKLQERKNDLKDVLRKLHAFGEERISHFGRTDYICKSVPTIVGGSRNSMSQRRSVVIRIPVDLYEEITELSKIEEPTDKDVERAYELFDEAEALVESRPF